MSPSPVQNSRCRLLKYITALALVAALAGEIARRRAVEALVEVSARWVDAQAVVVPTQASASGAYWSPGNGFKQKQAQGIDSICGSYTNDRGLVIQYDIGAMAGNYAMGQSASNRLWMKQMVVHGRPVDIVRTKDQQIFVSFPARTTDEMNSQNYPANFYATIAIEAELAEVIALCVQYPM